MSVKPSQPVIVTFGRYNRGDMKMVAAAELVFKMAVPTEFEGQFQIDSLSHQQVWLRKLFEKAVAGFYDVALDKNEWNVIAGKQLSWQISSKSRGIDNILPSMKTDIIIDQLSTGKRLIIDTKFNAITTSGWYREETLRNGYVYQIYAYLRSQEIENDPQSYKTKGMLLHPSIGDDVDECVTIQNHDIRFSTVNLADENLQIRSQLLNLALSSFC